MKTRGKSVRAQSSRAPPVSHKDGRSPSTGAGAPGAACLLYSSQAPVVRHKFTLVGCLSHRNGGRFPSLCDKHPTSVNLCLTTGARELYKRQAAPGAPAPVEGDLASTTTQNISRGLFACCFLLPVMGDLHYCDHALSHSCNETTSV